MEKTTQTTTVLIVKKTNGETNSNKTRRISKGNYLNGHTDLIHVLLSSERSEQLTLRENDDIGV